MHGSTGPRITIIERAQRNTREADPPAPAAVWHTFAIRTISMSRAIDTAASGFQLYPVRTATVVRASMARSDRANQSRSFRGGIVGTRRRGHAPTHLRVIFQEAASGLATAVLRTQSALRARDRHAGSGRVPAGFGISSASPTRGTISTAGGTACPHDCGCRSRAGVHGDAWNFLKSRAATILLMPVRAVPNLRFICAPMGLFAASRARRNSSFTATRMQQTHLSAASR